MKKFLKGMSISLTGAIIIMLFTGCTPGKAQTRGNDYKGSFQNEEFEAFDSDKNVNDDTIPPYNKNKVSDSGEKYADNSKNNDNKKPRVKSGNDANTDGNKDYREVKGKYSDSDNYEDESNAKINSKKNIRDEETENTEIIPEKFYQKGFASWYGREFHGKTTASGDKFDMNDMTAAHKTLPFGTIVEVRNLENGKSVKLKINDRGPYRGNRIIDLSFAGAKELAMVKTGEAKVGIKIIKMGDNNTANCEEPSKKYVEPVADDDTYMNVKSEKKSDYNDSIKLQAGAFYSRKNAENLKSKIESMTDRPVKIVQDGNFFKVRVEGLRDKKETNKLKDLLNEERISSFSVD
jgi:rare lipoprotein A